MSATLVTPKTLSGGEIITHLINASDGEGLHFDGAAGYISGSDSAFPSGNAARSVEFIIQPDEVTTANKTIFGYGTGTTYDGWGIDLDANVLNVQTYGQAVSAKSTTSLEAGKVYHCVVTYDGTTVTYYVNGNAAGTGIFTLSAPTTTLNGFEIGRTLWASGRQYFEGTVYRLRLWNKTLSQAEVTASYENATVPFIDQYGEANLVDAAASAFTSGTYSWVKYGSNTITNVSNTLAIAYGNDERGAYNYLRDSFDLTTDLTVGKKYRLRVDAKYTGGAAGVRLELHDGAAYSYSAALTTSLVTYNLEFTAQGATDCFYQLDGMVTSNVVTIDNWQVDELGCVADYDLAFANPSPSPDGQSLMVRDRAGAADGTSSIAGVVQVTPIEQLNAKAARIGTTAATPADGELLVSGQVGVGAAPEAPLGISKDENDLLLIHRASSVSGTQALIRFSNSAGTGVWSSYIGSERTGGGIGDLVFGTGGSSEASVVERMRIDSAGNVGIGGAPTGLLEARKDQDAATQFFLTNDTGGTAAKSQVWVRTNSSSIQLSSYSSSFTTANQYVADSGLIEANLSSQLGLSALGAVPIVMYTDSAERLRIASDGTVGVGVVPETDWDSAHTAIQFGLTSSLVSHTSANGWTQLMKNARYVGGGVYKYITTDEATRYVQKDDGSHAFEVAASGTADAAITFSEALTISNAGHVTMVGSTGDDIGLQVKSPVLTSSVLLVEDNSTLTTGRLGYFYSNADSTATRSLVWIRNDNVNATGTAGLKITNDSTGPAIELDGCGIKFPATQRASADANTLDDYEEGTWTPAYTPQTNAFTSIGYVGAIPGRYTKIGNMVTVWGYIGTTGITVGTASGAVYLTGLPFAQATVGAGNFQNGVGADKWGTNNVTHIQLSSGEQQFGLFYRTSSTVNETAVNVTDMSTGGDANYTKFVFSYRV